MYIIFHDIFFWKLTIDPNHNQPQPTKHTKPTSTAEEAVPTLRQQLMELQAVLQASHHFTPSRKASLYSNFDRLKNINEDGYQANITAWREVLLVAASKGAFLDKVAIPAGPQLVKSLTDSKAGVPLAISTVLDDMVSDGTLIPSSTFLKSGNPMLRLEWSAKGLARAAFWSALSHVFNFKWTCTESDGTLKQEKYIVLDLLVSRSVELLRKLKARSTELGSFYSSTVFEVDSIAEYGNLSALDLECCLTYLSRETNHIVYDEQRKVVKLGKGPLTDNDVALADIQSQVESIQQRVDYLETRIGECERAARQAIGRKDRAQAKSFLRSKTYAESAQHKALSMVNQLEAVLAKVNEASDNVSTVAALTSARNLLSSLNHEVGSVERVSDLVGQVRQDLSQTSQVTKELSRVQQDDINLEDVEHELLELELDALTTLPDTDPAIEDVVEEEEKTQESQKEAVPA